MPGALWWRLRAKASHGLPPRLHLSNRAAQCSDCVLSPAGPWERRLRDLLCTFIPSAGRLLSNLRPWGPRCFYSPSWHQVTVDCGRGPVLQETPAGAPTGWTAWRYCCGGWWWWRKWPRRGLGCTVLKGRDTQRQTVVFTCLDSQRLRPTSACSISLVLRKRQRHTNCPSALWLQR